MNIWCTPLLSLGHDGRLKIASNSFQQIEHVEWITSIGIDLPFGIDRFVRVCTKRTHGVSAWCPASLRKKMNAPAATMDTTWTRVNAKQLPALGGQMVRMCLVPSIENNARDFQKEQGRY